MIPRKKSFAKLTGLASALIVCSAVLVTIDYRTAHLNEFRSALFWGTKPLIAVAEWPVKARVWLAGIISDRETLMARIVEVKEENANLHQRVIELEDLEQRSAWLLEMLNAREKLEHEVELASLSAISLQPQSHRVVVDLGEDDGAFIGQPVLDHRGIIGQITAVTANESAVTLLTSPNHSIPVRVRRNGLLAIANGLGLTNRLSVPYINAVQDIRVGDVLVASGIGDRFPAGYPVAKVQSVTWGEGEPFAEIVAEPLATLNYGNQVLLVWNQRTPSPEIEYSINVSEQQ